MYDTLDNHYLPPRMDTTKCHRYPTVYHKVPTADNFCTCSPHTSYKRDSLSCFKLDFYEKSV